MSDEESAGDGGVEGRVKGVLARLARMSGAERILISIAALFASLVVGAIVLFIAGYAASCEEPGLVLAGANFCYDPWNVYVTMFLGAFGSSFNLALTLQGMTLLLFGGLAVAISFRSGLFNIGVQGQMVVGALASALGVVWLAPIFPSGAVGALTLIPTGIIIGAIFGGLYGVIPGALKAYADANEVITTIMLNFIASGVAFYLVSTFFQDPQSQSIQTKTVPGYAQLKPLLPMFENASFSILALLFALALAGIIYYFLTQTSYGFDLRTAGTQPKAAEYGGIDSKRVTVSTMALSGILAGIGGAIWVLMVLGRWRTGMPGYGFDGITVSILAGNNPLGVILASGLFGVLKSGSLAINFKLGAPPELVDMLRGLVILFVAMPEFFRMLARRFRLHEEEDSQVAAADGGQPRDEDSAEDGARTDGGPTGTTWPGEGGTEPGDRVDGNADADGGGPGTDDETSDSGGESQW